MIKRVSGVIILLVLASIIPAFAISDNQTSGVSSGNFTETKSVILDMINQQITKLQELSANVSATNNMTELRDVMIGNYFMHNHFRHGMRHHCYEQRVHIAANYSDNNTCLNETIANDTEVNDTTITGINSDHSWLMSDGGSSPD